MYSEGLEKQVALIDWLTANPNLDDGDGNRLPVYQIRTSVEEGQTVWVSKDIAHLLAQTAGSFPNAPLNQEGVPLTNGFAWFEEPLPLGGTLRTASEVLSHDPGLRALSWLYWRYNDAEAKTRFNGLAAVYWVDIPGRPLPWPESVTEWDWGKGWDDWQAGPTSNAARAQLRTRLGQQRRYLHTLFAFMQQSILVAPAERADRPTRRRLEQAGWTREPLIRVVQLRRRETASTASDHGDEPADWTCRWIVRGHWRQQACGPGQRDRRPKYILPHVKGPEDKPLKPPRATVFAVVR